jgi:hypothetical protein
MICGDMRFLVVSWNALMPRGGGEIVFLSDVDTCREVIPAEM